MIRHNLEVVKRFYRDFYGNQAGMRGIHKDQPTFSLSTELSSSLS